MAQPHAYNRDKDFMEDFGNETDHSALNDELDKAANSINDIRANLAILQADDRKLRPSVVTPDSISPELRLSLVEGVVMDAQAMLDESQAASEMSSASAEKATESETAAAVSAGQAAASAKEAADSAVQTQQIGEQIEKRAGEIVETAMEEATAQATLAAGSAQVAGESADEAKRHAEVANQRGIPIGTVVRISGAEMPAGYLMADGSAVGRKTYPDLFSAIGTRYGEGDGESTFNLPDSNRDIGTIVPFAHHAVPPDFRLCDGAEVGRTAYAELFAAIGTTYGEGDGTTTFNLPNLIGRFAEGSAMPGTVKEAGLPNITGTFRSYRDNNDATTGSVIKNRAFVTQIANKNTAVSAGNAFGSVDVSIDASGSNPVYGNADTVQPPALTVCYGIRVKNGLHAAIKAFDAAVDPGMVDLTGLANDVQRNRTPAGTIGWFAMSTPPSGYLVADGSAVGRATYPNLFAAIGTTYGEGDGKTTFNLPDLIGRFAEGSTIPGTVKEAGLPDIVGHYDTGDRRTHVSNTTGPFFKDSTTSERWGGYTDDAEHLVANAVGFDAARANPIYGNSDTVQPPALTLLPCIKAFDGAVDTGLVDITALAQEVAGKADKSEIMGLVMPAAYLSLTFPGSAGTLYTAPADGYFYICLSSNGTAYGHVNIYNASGKIAFGSMVPLVPGIASKAYLPVGKGEKCCVNWTNGNPSSADNDFGFVYLEGGKP